MSLVIPRKTDRIFHVLKQTQKFVFLYWFEYLIANAKTFYMAWLMLKVAQND